MRSVFVFILLSINSLSIFGQAAEPTSTLVQSFDAYRQNTLQEKLFIHTDQAFYLTGETLWFRVYYVDATFHKPLDLSKVAYVELLDNAGKSVVQTKVALAPGGGNGTLFLPASLRSGNYLMRAYTNWMKNVSADYFFEKPLTIVNPFTPLDLPDPKAPATGYDCQFFPEGGNLVQGLASKVAFKVSDSTGRGVAVRGWLLNGQNDTLTQFSSYRFGMGSFVFTPSQTTTYRVLMRDSTGRLFTRPLPAVLPQGYVMTLTDAGEQLKITVATNVPSALAVYLFAHTRNAIKAAEMQPIQEGQATFTIDKKTLGEGISHLTIFDAAQHPVCERLYFKQPVPLAITLKTDQPTYVSRTKVTLNAAVLAPAAQPNQAALSVAVYRMDSLAAAAPETILSSLWLTSDLPGYIESPTYYVQPETPAIAQSTDNLMLTHGWRRFRWTDVLQGKPTVSRPFVPEVNGPLIQGTLTDPATGAPVVGKTTYLSTIGKPIRLTVSKSDTAGRVMFEMPDFYGPKSIIAQTDPQDSTAKLTIIRPFLDTSPTHTLSDLRLSESQTAPVLSRSVAMQVQAAYWGDRGIRYVVPPVDSAAFYGRPGESYLLDAYTRFPRMEEVLREYVLGVMPRKRQERFRLDVLNAPYRAIFEEPSLVLIDGVPVFDMDKVIDFSPLKIRQLDVVTNRYLMGSAVFSGIISLMTYKGDLAGFPLDGRVLKLDYDGLQLQREFYAPRYDRPNQQTSRLPDGRTLLYWNPALQTSAQGNSQVEFYTSDQPGTYFIEVNGLTKDGYAGSGRAVFSVKNAPK